MPDLLRLLARNALIGFVVAGLAVTALVVFDIARIGSLTANAEQGWFIRALLTFMVGLTCASAQMGFAVMLLPYEQDEPARGPPAIKSNSNASTSRATMIDSPNADHP